MSDWTLLIAEAEALASELVRRLAALELCEPTPRQRSTWQQSSALVRRVRGELREARDRDRRRARLEARS